MGYHGCPSPDSVKRFISGDKLWPWNGNDEWLVHAASPELTGETPYKYRIELMTKQVRELFCEIPDNLDDFSIASQISQAEAFKYFIELFRTAKWRKTGIVWWNLVDAWPQFSDAVVDYYGVKKLAFAYIKRSQAPLCLMFGEPKDWALPLFVSNDTGKSMQIQYKVSDIESKTQLCASECFVEANSARKIWETPYSMSEKRMYLIEWSAFGEAFINHYLSGQPSFDLQKYIALAKQGGIMQR
jgi:beta-mannosidase